MGSTSKSVVDGLVERVRYEVLTAMDKVALESTDNATAGVAMHLAQIAVYERHLRELGETLQQCKRAMDGLAEHHPDMVSLAMRAARLRAARLLAETPREERYEPLD